MKLENLTKRTAIFLISFVVGCGLLVFFNLRSPTPSQVVERWWELEVGNESTAAATLETKRFRATRSLRGDSLPHFFNGISRVKSVEIKSTRFFGEDRAVVVAEFKQENGSAAEMGHEMFKEDGEWKLDGIQ